MTVFIRRAALVSLVCTLLLAIAPVANATEICGNGIVESSEECDPGGGLFFDGNPSLSTCTTGGDCFYANSCCKFNCQYVGQGASCFDGEECTVNDLCNQVGDCVGDAVPSGSSCDDDFFCTITDACDGSGHCLGSGDPCSGGAECRDTCNELDLSCESPAGMGCGDASSHECTDADTCDGVGNCDTNDAPSGTAAPLACADSNDCTLDECNGSGGCQYLAAAPGSACGDPGDTECGDPDICDATGVCLSNDAAAGTGCGDATDTDCTDPDTCDGAGGCQGNDAAVGTSAPSQCADANECREDQCDGSGGCQNPSSAPGTVCGDSAVTECTAADTCDGSGACQDNDAPAGTAAPASCDDANSCTADQCNGGGGCQQTNLGAGSVCGDASDTECSNPDSCDGAGACESNDEAMGLACGDGSFSDCTMPDVCNGAGLCDANHFPDGSTCEDGDFCTVSDACSAGQCDAGVARDCGDDNDHCTHDFCDSDSASCRIVEEPKPHCLPAGIGQLVLLDKANDGRDKLKWKWTRGAPVGLTELGDPSSSTNYELCLYDTMTSDDPIPVMSTELVSRHFIPPGNAWAQFGGGRGYLYKDKAGAVEGLSLIKLKSGEAPKLGLKAQGANLLLPGPLDAAKPGQYFHADPFFSAQLVSSTGQCWTTDFDISKKNNAKKYKTRRKGVVIK